jgi:hypothetical protein
VAGLFEEVVKYLAVRRLVFKSFVVDPRALMVYACAAGTSVCCLPGLDCGSGQGGAGA